MRPSPPAACYQNLIVSSKYYPALKSLINRYQRQLGGCMPEGSVFFFLVNTFYLETNALLIHIKVDNLAVPNDDGSDINPK